MNTTPKRRRRAAAAALVALVFAALVLAAVETLGTTGEPATARTVGLSVQPAARAGSNAPAPSAPIDTDATTSASTRTRTPGFPGGAGQQRPQPGAPGVGSVSDPHRLVAPQAHGGNPLQLPADTTPLAAAAGTEPGSMDPLAGLPAGWTSSVHRFTVKGITRSYLLLRPPVAKPPTSPSPGAKPLMASRPKLPVVLVLHGRGLTPAGIERLTQMPATTGPAILVYPAGYGRSWDAGGCCGVAHAASIDDVTFLTDTVRQVLAAQRDADPSRVYMVGYSNGGRMAYRMACADPGLLAGIAAVEAVPVAACPATTALPAIIVASSRDPLLAIDNGQRPKVTQGYVQPTVASTVDEWRRLDGCSTAGTTSATGVARVDTWAHCAGSGRVAYALYSGGSHAWPAGTEGAAGTPAAEDLIWAWLTRGIVITAASA